MARNDEVELFLRDFKAKLGIYGILFRDERGKNSKALAELEITSNYRIEVLKKLKLENYSEGPITERLYNNADMWVFGALVKEKEIYIKISMGIPNSKTLCISFHLAEYPMKYPLRAT
jgi:hypothetical protein